MSKLNFAGYYGTETAGKKNVMNISSNGSRRALACAPLKFDVNSPVISDIGKSNNFIQSRFMTFRAEDLAESNFHFARRKHITRVRRAHRVECFCFCPFLLPANRPDQVINRRIEIAKLHTSKRERVKIRECYRAICLSCFDIDRLFAAFQTTNSSTGSRVRNVP